jgi:hypothetical protein
MDFAELQTRLDRLETAEAARSVAAGYATAIDTRDWTLLESVFTEDACLHVPSGEFIGRDAVMEFYRNALGDTHDRKHFLVNNHITWVSPGEAQMHSYLLFTLAGDTTSIVGWGDYQDRVVVVDGVGRIADKTISLDVNTDVRTGWATS